MFPSSWMENRFYQTSVFGKRGKDARNYGATGSGKSSIINMLHRFYDTTEGSVRLDGVDIRKISLRQLRRSVAVVLQDVFLFSDTIEENIKMGNRSTMQMDEIKSAAASAQASSFIEKWMNSMRPLSVSAV